MYTFVVKLIISPEKPYTIKRLRREYARRGVSI